MYRILYAFILSFPFLIYPWGPNPYYSIPKFIYLVTFTALLWSVFIVQAISKKIRFGRILVVDWILLLFIGLIVVSTIHSVDVNKSIYGEILRFEGLLSLFSYLSLFFFSYRFILEERVVTVIRTMGIGAFIASIYGILQHYLIDFLPRFSEKIGYTRNYSFFDNPNFFGSYLVIMMALVMTLYLLTKNKKHDFVYLVIVTVLFIALLFSLTRSAWLGAFTVFILLTLYIFIKNKGLQKKWIALSLTLLLTFVLINTFEGDVVANRASSIVDNASMALNGESNAGSSRLFIWKKSLPLVREYFWLGSGPDTFAEVFPHNPEELKTYFNNESVKVDKAHNEYIQMAVTLGVPFLLLYMYFILHIFLKGILAVIYKKNNQTVIVGLLVLVLGYLVQAFFNISVITVAPFFWISLGLLYRLSNNKLDG